MTILTMGRDVVRFRRGAVVARGRRYGVVWSHDQRGVVLLPVLRPWQLLSGDITLDLTDLVALGVPIAGAVIRARPGPVIAAGDQTQVGAVPGGLMCRVVQQVVRVSTERCVVDRWSGRDRHRDFARSSAVRT